MKKIGILTFHRALNYGAVLQAYGLQTSLNHMKENDNDDDCCEIIDYRNRVLEDGCRAYIKMSQEKNIKHAIAALINIPIRIIRKMRFRRFEKKYLTLSKMIRHGDMEAINQKFDTVIVGSDQVWNCELTGNDTIFLLNGYKNNQGKSSYAASFGFANIPEGKKETYKACLSEFRHISVREESGKEIVKQTTEKEAIVHIDPTLLLEAKDWEVFSKRINNAGKYILIYSINPHKYILDFALDCGRTKKLPVYFITSNMLDVKNYKNMKMIFTPTVEQFISYIKEADTVITNSFHGTVFSIIFHKTFYVEIDYVEKYNYRIESLLHSLNLEERVIKQENYQEEKSIDWNKVELMKRKYREQARKYLNEIYYELEEA